MNILVFGANGQVGSEIKSISNHHASSHLRFHFFNRQALDITDTKALIQVFDSYKPDFVINCAAYTQVDQAEDDHTLNFQINSEAVKMIAQTCLEFNATLIHYSSDYVYDIDTTQPLQESDNTEPKGAYAMAKHSGEQQIQKILDKYIIIRTSWVYSTFGNNFVKSMIRLAESRNELNIVSDQIGSPTYAKDLAHATLDIIKHIVNNELKDTSGIYNYSNDNVTNWADFAKQIFSLANLDCHVNKITTEAYGAQAPRPLWSVLSKQKIQNTFGLKIRTWQDALAECIEKILADN